MRDFLISKLKGAEVALKASMTESTILRKQAKADEEVTILNSIVFLPACFCR